MNKPKKKLEYADRMGVEYVALIGAKETADGTVTVKHMPTRQSTTLPLGELVNFIGS